MTHVLLTGATGFLGSHLLEALLRDRYKVTILKRSTSNTWRIDHLLKRVRYFDVDIVSVEDVFRAEKVDVVVHTACSYGRDSRSVSDVVEANLLFGLQVLDAATTFKTSTFINTDTFFNTDKTDESEISLPKYLNSYTLSKKQFLEWLKNRTQSIRVVNLKLQHIYGPRDDQAKFVPWLINELMECSGRVALTEGRQKRDFIYVDDVVSAYLLVIKNRKLLDSYSEFDVGTGELTTVRDFVSEIYAAIRLIRPNLTSELRFGEKKMQTGEIMDVSVDNRQLKKMGWSPKIKIRDGIVNLLSHYN